MIQWMSAHWIDMVSAALGLTTVYLAGRGKVLNFWVGYIYGAFLFWLFWHLNLYASMCIQLVAFGINVYGHYHWTHPDPDKKGDDGSLVVTAMTYKEWGKYIILFLIILCSISLGLVHTDDPQPLLDGFCTSLILLAQILSAQKKTECWIVWLMVNVTNLILYLRAGLVFMPCVALLYLANGVWSLITWKRNERNSAN